VKSGWIAALVFSLTLTVPAVTLAQDAEYSAAQQRGTASFQAGRYEEAAEHFKEAFAADPRGNLLYNIGLCYEKAGRTEDAVKFYQRFVAALPSSPKRPAVQRKIDELKTELSGRYQEVNVATSPSDAVIFVDDKAKGALGRSPVTFKLLPGTYTIIAELPGHEPARQRIELLESAPAMVDLALIPSDEVGTVTFLVSERNADVMVDGRRVGKSPVDEPLRLRAGPHDVLVMKPGFAPYKRKIDVPPGGETRLDVRLSGEEAGDLAGGGTGGGGGGGSIWPWVTMGVGVAAVGAGVFTGLSAQTLYDQLDEKRKAGDLIAASDIDIGSNLVLTTNLLMGIGGAAILGGLAWWILDDPGPDRSGDVQFGADVREGGAVIRFTGAF
jgi:Tfp pilus assembly protein PilF